jgi:hypothetical protein
MQDIAPLIQVKPRLADRIDEDGLIEVLADARGAPARMFNSRDRADQLGKERQQQMQTAQAMELAKSGAGVLKDVAGAQASAAQADQAVPA